MQYGFSIPLDFPHAVGTPALSPVFTATWETAQAFELLASLDTPLPAGGVVHVEGELVPKLLA